MPTQKLEKLRAFYNVVRGFNDPFDTTFFALYAKWILVDGARPAQANISIKKFIGLYKQEGGLECQKQL